MTQLSTALQQRHFGETRGGGVRKRLFDFNGIASNLRIENCSLLKINMHFSMLDVHYYVSFNSCSQQHGGVRRTREGLHSHADPSRLVFQDQHGIPHLREVTKASLLHIAKETERPGKTSLINPTTFKVFCDI